MRRLALWAVLRWREEWEGDREVFFAELADALQAATCVQINAGRGLAITGKSELCSIKYQAGQDGESTNTRPPQSRWQNSRPRSSRQQGTQLQIQIYFVYAKHSEVSVPSRGRGQRNRPNEDSWYSRVAPYPWIIFLKQPRWVQFHWSGCVGWVFRLARSIPNFTS